MKKKSTSKTAPATEKTSSAPTLEHYEYRILGNLAKIQRVPDKRSWHTFVEEGLLCYDSEIGKRRPVDPHLVEGSEMLTPIEATSARTAILEALDHYVQIGKNDAGEWVTKLKEREIY